MKLAITNQQIIIAEKQTLVASTENVYECEFSFGSEWEGYSKTAIFEGCGNTYQVSLDSTLKCKIPNAAIAESGYIRIGVLGTKVSGSTTLRYPTVWSSKIWVEVATEASDS